MAISSQKTIEPWREWLRHELILKWHFKKINLDIWCISYLFAKKTSGADREEENLHAILLDLVKMYNRA